MPRAARHAVRSVLCAAALAIGCAAGAPEAPETLGGRPPSDPSDLRARLERPEDRSLATEQLLRLGVPSADAAWDAAAYERAADTLTDVARVDPQRLPRHQSARSGDVFARIVSNDNLEALGDPGLSRGFRVQQGGGQHTAIQRILLLYLAAAEGDVRFDIEIAAILGVYLHATRQLWPLLSDALAAPGDADTVERRSAAVASVRKSFGDVLLGATRALADFGFRPEARQRLAVHLAAHGPALAGMLEGDVSVEVERLLREQLARETDPVVRDEIAGALERW